MIITTLVIWFIIVLLLGLVIGDSISYKIKSILVYLNINDVQSHEDDYNNSTVVSITPGITIALTLMLSIFSIIYIIENRVSDQLKVGWIGIVLVILSLIGYHTISYLWIRYESRRDNLNLPNNQDSYMAARDLRISDSITNPKVVDFIWVPLHVQFSIGIAISPLFPIISVCFWIIEILK